MDIKPELDRLAFDRLTPAPESLEPLRVHDPLPLLANVELPLNNNPVPEPLVVPVIEPVPPPILRLAPDNATP